MLIEKITRQKEWYQLHLADGTKVLVSEDQLVANRLLKGQEISPAMLADIKKKGAQEVGLQLAYGYISYQLRSQKEVVTYLRTKEIPNSDIAPIIERLIQLNLIDDVVFAQSFVRTQIKVAEKGPSVINQKLKEKGIKETIIAEALDQYDSGRQYEVALKLAESFLNKSSQNSYRTKLQKVNVHLRQKGFGTDTIHDVLEALDYQKDDDREATLVAKQGAIIFRRQQKLPRAQRVQKVKEGLFRKGFSMDEINYFVENYRDEDDE